MPENISMTLSIASRYATALFELSRESSALDRLEQDISELRRILSESNDFMTLIKSPVYARDEMSRAVGAVASRANLSDITKNTLALMAANRRLFALQALLDQLESLMDNHRGVVTAEVTSAQKLDETEIGRLKDSLGRKAGRDIKFNLSVDESLIGGLVAKLGSRMVDTSIRTKLSNLRNVMREVN